MECGGAGRFLSEIPLTSLGSCLCRLTGELVTSVVEPRGSPGVLPYLQRFNSSSAELS